MAQLAATILRRFMGDMGENFLKRVHFRYKWSVRKNVTNPPEFEHTSQGLYVGLQV